MHSENPLWLTALVHAGRTFTRGFLHLLYPSTCWVCAEFLNDNQTGFCHSCRTALTHDPHPTCPRCASSVGPFVHLEDGCTRCRNESFAFDQAVRLGPYDGLLRDVVLRLKHAHGEGLAEMMGKLWAEHLGDRLRSFKADVLVPVPLHWRKRLGRGYNQSQAVARVLAGKLGIPCQPRWLRRVRHTQPQTQQSPAARRDNVRGAFRARAGLNLQGKTVMLVDDVMTTGSTASEAARALKPAKPARIIVAVLAHGS
jgi:ComF family protein